MELYSNAFLKINIILIIILNYVSINEPINYCEDKKKNSSAFNVNKYNGVDY